ncbi:hypothetical protein BKA67DRAFT_656166 [Truncatella angustata]|uniref:Rhodopsin domain-containing protein n=1 Tax=Truncatella angustata TaxID=152316 RepID=A0A9P8UTX5_9PEZI|nr:uncharacterized protein BKA67DRAFT_656166 [Truncatella angustata]KAH6657930.1 hypothetical protein BKA67DRAFT_656166 [Truncatella angustata]KAH8195919.1 hypothetical protein TruAng_009932 [Truncatella angustata]
MSMPPRAVLLVVPVTTFFILAIACIGLRLWAKRIKKTSLRFCDYAILVAAVFAAGYLGICWLVVDRGGVGYPLVQVSPPARALTQKSFVVAWLLQSWGNTFVRLSILDFIAHVFSVKKFRMVVYFFEACAIAYLVGCTITFFAVCRPMRYNFSINPVEIQQYCGDLSLKFLLSAIFNLVLDVCILVLPMPMLLTLQLNIRKKLSLVFVFSLGIFVCFATAWRTYNVVKFSTPEAKMNFTMTVVEDALWSGLEITLGIINACLPVMPPALQQMFKAPFLKLLTFSSRPASKPSKFSDSDISATSGSSGSRKSWLRIGGAKGVGRGSDWSETAHSMPVIRHSVDVESRSIDQISTDRMGSTTRLATNSTVYQYPTVNQYQLSSKMESQGQNAPPNQQW